MNKCITKRNPQQRAGKFDKNWTMKCVAVFNHIVVQILLHAEICETIYLFIPTFYLSFRYLLHLRIFCTCTVGFINQQVCLLLHIMPDLFFQLSGISALVFK